MRHAQGLDLHQGLILDGDGSGQVGGAMVSVLKWWHSFLDKLFNESNANGLPLVNVSAA